MNEQHSLGSDGEQEIFGQFGVSVDGSSVHSEQQRLVTVGEIAWGHLDC